MRILKKYKNQLTAAAGLLVVLGYVFGLVGNTNAKNLVLIAAAVIAGTPIAGKAYQAVRMKVFSIELLVTVAVIGAFFIQEYTEAAVVTFLFQFGAYLEARTLQKTRASLKKLLDLAPQEATVIRNGKEETVAVDEVQRGERLAIRSGGKVPVDGRVLTGAADVNEAPVTGEPVPVSKGEDDKVYSGTMVDHGYIEIIAEKVGDDTTFARIIELVEEAQEAKSKAAKFLDRFAQYYTPGIVLLSVVAWLITRDFHLAITFLVVACPGALVIGAPVSNVAGIGNGARHGVLLKGGEVIDKFSKVNTLVFDKTGTLTKGRPEVIGIQYFGSHDPKQVLAWVGSAEKGSEHHLSRAIVRKVQEEKLSLEYVPDQFSVIKGQGIRARIEDNEIFVGNRKLLTEQGILLADPIQQAAVLSEKQGETVVFAAINGEIAAMLSIADQIRADAKSALAELRRNGIQKVVMLTGDNRHTAQLVADELGLDEFQAELMPEDKVEAIQNLRESGHVVAMAGDGINDAPAIAAADIGLAMGDGGTDVSMETADVVLMADKLSQLSHAYALSKTTMRNMKQNIFFAVVVVVILLLGVLFGTVHLAAGMFVHELSILAVILNAMRLIRFTAKSDGKSGFAAYGKFKKNHQFQN